MVSVGFGKNNHSSQPEAKGFRHATWMNLPMADTTEHPKRGDKGLDESQQGTVTANAGQPSIPHCLL
jgi:hypothetical protein